METKATTCGLPLLLKFEPRPFQNGKGSLLTCALHEASGSTRRPALRVAATARSDRDSDWETGRLGDAANPVRDARPYVFRVLQREAKRGWVL